MSLIDRVALLNHRLQHINTIQYKNLTDLPHKLINWCDTNNTGLVGRIQIAYTDNLKGFTDGTEGVFHQTATQLCFVHQIRNCRKYVVWKDRKAFCADLKLVVYAAPNHQAAEDAILDLEDKWGQKYALATQSWKNNWDNLTAYFDYPMEIRKIIYTTNTIENLNRGIRKYTKTKVQFNEDQAALKAVYLAIANIEKKWSMPIQN